MNATASGTPARPADTHLPDAECERLARPVGSPFRLASLKLPPVRQRAVTALRALDVSLAEISETISEPQVAMSKLDWWRQALLDMTEGRAEHPVVQSLLAALDELGYAEEARSADSFFVARLEERLGATRVELEYEGFAAEDDLRSFLDARYGSLFSLYARLLEADEDATRAAQTLGRWHGRLERARLLGRHARAGRVYLPADQLAAHGLDEADLYRPQARAERERLFAEELERIRAGIEGWEGSRRPPRLFRILRAIDREHLRLMQADPGAITEARVEISPLRQWWLAWRASW
ncbi:phytoene/squalene synthase family protein [Guyparkeria sp.]|uniref:phytoene/squalene synthase family protein n=1 Tax=Guyparkeria sp. TaxID=2035736 RepID=UPI003970DFF5